MVRGLSCIILDTCSHDANWKSCDRNLLSFLKKIEAKLHSDRGWLATEGEEVRKVEVHTLHVTIVSLIIPHSSGHANDNTRRYFRSGHAKVGLCMFSNTKYGLLLYPPSDSNTESRLGEMEDRDFALDPPNVSIVS